MKTLSTLFIFLLIFSTTHAQWTNQNPVPDGNDLWSTFFIDDTGWIVGEDGYIKKTTNAGLDWIQQSSGTSNTLRSVQFIDQNTGWICGDSGLILKTTDGGQNWLVLNSGTLEKLVDIHFYNLNIGWIVGDAGTILKTTNSGTSWIAQSADSTVNLNSVDFVDEFMGYAVGDSSNYSMILKTTDGGLNWIQKSLNYLIYFLNTVEFIDANTGWIGGATSYNSNPKMSKTTDGGETWSNPSLMNIEGDQGGGGINSIFFKDANNGYAVGGGQNKTIRITTDGGSTWIYKSPFEGFYSGGLYSVHINNTGKGWAVGSSGEIFITEDDGNSWAHILTGSGPTQDHIYSVFFINENIGWAAGSRFFETKYEIILKTTNGGKIWKTQFGQGQGSHFANLYGSSFIDTSKIWVVGYGGKILRTTNGGTDWVQQTSGTTKILNGVSFTDVNNGTTVGQSGTILRTTNGGTDWVQQTSGTTSWLYGVSFTDANNGIAVGADGTIIRTTNGGTTWTSQTSGTESGLNGIKFFNSNVGMCVGNTGTVLLSTDGGGNWIAKNSGTTEALTAVTFTNSNSVWVAGSNGKILYTTDLGDNWIAYDSVTTNNLTSLSFINENTGWIGGTDGTMFKYSTESIPTIPMIPTNLTAIADTFIINLSWADNSNNETGFVIERKEGDSTIASSYTAIDTVAANEISFSDTGLTPNTTYTYRVFAINDAGISGYSNVAQTTTTSLPTTFQLTVSFFDGWNMVSIPGHHPLNQNVTTWWSNKDPGAGVFGFNEGYQQVTTVTPGQGYWMKHLGDKTYNTGDEWPANGILTVAHGALNRNAGWSFIGGYEYNAAVSGITTTPLGLQDSPVFGYSNGYQIVDYLIPGYGYWIKLSGTGSINLPNAFAKGTSEITEYVKDDWGKIIITDASGKSYTLYTVKGEVNLNDYELPPAPPEGMFDVRFGSGRYAEELSAVNQTIELNSLEYPVRVRVENADIRLQDGTGNGLNERLKSGEEVTINNSSINKLMVSADIIPATYSLDQNYPNPFNPSTKIEFSIPEDVNNVTLTIYNALGQRVAELVNSKMEAGKYSYVWNAGDVATGLYIYELRTDKFVSVKKMLLLK